VADGVETAVDEHPRQEGPGDSRGKVHRGGRHYPAGRRTFVDGGEHRK
jgi:hypothetical protein